MNDRYTLTGYIATLAALVIVFIAALVASAISPAIIGTMEVFGLGTITGGLIGVLRLPQKAGASDATLSAALGKLPDAPPAPPSATPSVTLEPGQAATVAAAPTQGA